MVLIWLIAVVAVANLNPARLAGGVADRSAMAALGDGDEECWLLYAYVVLSVLLFLLGVGAADPRLQGFGVLMLLSAPVGRPCIAELNHRWS